MSGTSWAKMADIEPTRGEGPGVITRDGCAVELYRKSPYRGELEVLAAHLPPKCSVLDLGCGGRGGIVLPLHAMGVEAIGIDNNTHKLFVDMRDKKMVGLVDLNSKQLVKTFDAPGMQFNTTLVVDPKSKRVFVGGRKPGILYIFDEEGKLITQKSINYQGISLLVLFHNLYKPL